MPTEHWFNDFVFAVNEFFTPTECEKYIQISEDIGYEDATVTSPSGAVLRTDVRNNQRVMFCNEEIAACLLYTSPSPRDLSTSRMPSSA